MCSRVHDDIVAQVLYLIINDRPHFVQFLLNRWKLVIGTIFLLSLYIVAQHLHFPSLFLFFGICSGVMQRHACENDLTVQIFKYVLDCI